MFLTCASSQDRQKLIISSLACHLTKVFIFSLHNNPKFRKISIRQLLENVITSKHSLHQRKVTRPATIDHWPEYRHFGSLISLVHLSAPLCPQAPTMNLLSTCLMVCSILGSIPISFPKFSSLVPPSPTDWLHGKWIGTLLVVFGVVNLVKCPD